MKVGLMTFDINASDCFGVFEIQLKLSQFLKIAKQKMKKADESRFRVNDMVADHHDQASDAKVSLSKERQ